ncbi:translocation/assembly module TamB domain-containing protein [Alistipes timonensis]|uniref:translocation/assembly module TamB domain-containing protein n=1 Tax=Alistipes timonensis TaxID=1465754 RepID=UPI00214B8AC1|nr:translocation/assembly module TamB [Alistipes timonensis]MCR2031629.1 translocation/assembly module TamB [Alistipes timonensis]
MLKKIVKYTLRTLLVILLAALLIPALLYVPAVQDFIRGKAVGYASEALGMELSVGRIRLAFPLRLTVEETLLVDRADTLVDCGRLSLDVALWPLIRKEVVVRSFELDRIAAHYKDSTGGLEMRLAAGLLSLGETRADLRAQRADIARITLSDGDIFLDLTESAPAEKADSTAPLAWSLDIRKISILNTAFGMHTSPAVTELTVRLADGEVEACRVRLDIQQVDVKSILLDRGAYSYLTAPADPEKEASPEPAPSGDTAPSLPWTVRAGSIALTDNRAEYGTLGHRPAAGFDPALIALSALDLTIDSVYNRGSDIALQLRRMRFTERSGLSVRNASGRFEMDSTGISLSGFELETPYSRLRADVSAGPGILHTEPATPLSADLSAAVNTKEIAALYPAAIPPALNDRTVRMNLTAAGTLADISRFGLDISSPGHLDFTADGRAQNLLDPESLNASARFEGDFRDLAFLVELLPDSALRRRVTIPDQIRLHGSAGTDRGTLSVASTLAVDAGRIVLNGRLDPRKESYDAEFRCDSFPVYRFLPADSLGMLDLALTARGAGFDPLQPQTRTSLRAQIDRAEYRGRDFGGIGIEADLEEHRLSGKLSDRNEALRLSLLLSGTLTGERQEVRLAGKVAGFDLAQMGFTPKRIGGSFLLDASASATRPGCYAARIGLDSIEIRNGSRTDRIRATSVSFASDTASTRAGVSSGDLSLQFSSRSPLDSLIAALTRSADTLARQIRLQNVDMEQLQPVLPDFDLQATAGRNNILNNLLKSRKASFKALEIRGGNHGPQPVSLRMRVEGLASGGIVLDTVQFGVAQQGKRLAYRLRAANAPGNLDHVAQAALYGSLAGNTVTVNLWQKNRSGREGFRFGLDAAWTDSLVRASVTPRNPLFGFEPWEVNPGNYLVYRFDKHVEADLDLTHGNQRFALRSVSAPGAPDGIRLDIAGLNIGSMLELLPSAPPVDGVLGADVTLNLAPDSLCVRGDVSVSELSYEKQRFGNIDFGLFYGQGRGHRADARLMLDGAEVLTVAGDYRTDRESPLDLTVSVPGLPLRPVNIFLPEDLLRLSGDLQANVHVQGAPDRLKLNGGVRFAQTEVRVPMIGTSFRLSSDTIRIADSRVRFNDYAVTAPNKNPLTIRGSVDLSDFAQMKADLALRASDFQFVNVARKEGAPVYGKAYLDLDATARGPLDELVVRGSLALLGGTDISYVMQDSPMDVKERPQNVVTFVSFRDLDAQEPSEAAPAVRIGGMDVLLNVDINSDVKAGVDLSANGENRIDLQGGGNLTYTMNPLGDVSLSGKYVLSGGTVRYNPPVISQKIFRITPDGYVEWVGNIADPAFNITAVETVRANVSSNDQDARPVNFNISINIRNTLNDLAVSFDLAAPEDLTLQNELNSLTAEQRATQAMNLLIYNTYTGPGSTGKASSENPLNSFIQKELNQWAQNNLKGVDLSFGINSYGEDDPNGQRTDYSYRLSKSLFSNRVRAVIGGKISTDADPSQNLKENLIDDISLEYMLTKRDNMYLRLFRHTGYESILEGEITETGVGFVIRKKLLRLGDLFRLTKRSIEKQQRNESEEHPK